MALKVWSSQPMTRVKSTDVFPSGLQLKLYRPGLCPVPIPEPITTRGKLGRVF